jgi:hypothetical protein
MAADAASQCPTNVNKAMPAPCDAKHLGPSGDARER